MPVLDNAKAGRGETLGRMGEIIQQKDAGASNVLITRRVTRITGDCFFRFMAGGLWGDLSAFTVRPVFERSMRGGGGEPQFRMADYPIPDHIIDRRHTGIARAEIRHSFSTSSLRFTSDL